MLRKKKLSHFFSSGFWNKTSSEPEIVWRHILNPYIMTEWHIMQLYAIGNIIYNITALKCTDLIGLYEGLVI